MDLPGAFPRLAAALHPRQGQRQGSPLRPQPPTGSWRSRRAALIGVMALAVPIAILAGAPPASAAPAYYVAATVGVGDNPYWLGVDPSTDTIYVANSSTADNTVSVIDGATNTVTATVNVGSMPYGVGVDPSTDTIYVSNMNDNTVSVIDGATNTVTATVNVGTDPDAVGVDPSTDTVYVANYADSTVSVISGATNTVTATVNVGSGPDGVGVDPSTDTVYVANYSDSTASVISGATNTVTATVNVGTQPFGVGVDPLTDTVYVANYGDNTVSVINGATNVVSTTVSVNTAFGVDVDPSTGTVYVSSLLSATVSEIDGSTNIVTATVGVGGDPSGVGVDPSTHTAYVANYNGLGSVSVIATATAPGAPTIGTATAGSAAATVSFTPPASDGGSAITGYTVTASDSTTPANGGQAATGSGSPITVPGLTDGDSYTFKVTATNTVNTGPPSQSSNAVTPQALPSLTTTPDPASVTLGSSPTTLKDSAVLSGGEDPTGTIIFTLNFDGPIQAHSETVTVSGNGTYTTPTGYTLPTGRTVAGAYQWFVTYLGDNSNVEASDDSLADGQVTVGAASPSLTTAPNSTSTSFGTPASLKDTATLSGGYSPTGSIAFTLYSPTNTLLDTETVAVSGNGTYTTPTGDTVPVTNSGTIAGSYQWDATYSSDRNNKSVSDNGATNERVVISPATTALSYTGEAQVGVNSTFIAAATLTSPAASCYRGQPVNLSVSPDPLNTTISSESLGTPSSTASGTASLARSTTGWANGVYTITASYAGTANCVASTDTASLAVTSPGQLAFGAGWYTVANVGQTSFGFVVAPAPHSTSTERGQLNVVTPGKWWFQASVTSYGKTSSTQGLLAGTGSLYVWDPTVNEHRGGWHLVTSKVTYKATANAATKTTAASFGINIADTPTPAQPALPNSSPTALSRGRIFIT
jgi:YVTN family beta-propeller protein